MTWDVSFKVLAEVMVRTEAATIIKNEVQTVSDKAQMIVDEITHERAIAEEKLEAAKPALQEAENALNVSCFFCCTFK